MLESRQIEAYSNAARPFYSYELAYHNWDHALAVMRDVDVLAERVASRGTVLARGALQVAAAWHDAGFHEDHQMYGFETKEHYSAFLLEQHLAGTEVSDGEKEQMRLAILGTIHGSTRESLNTLALHRADVANIGGPYQSFVRSSLLLWEEHDERDHTISSFSDYIEGAAKYIAFIAEEARVELPRLGEPVGTPESYDTIALDNLRRISAAKPRI